MTNKEMARLTEPSPAWDGDIIMCCQGCMYHQDGCAPPACNGLMEVANKLAAYEDTGLSPEEVEALQGNLDAIWDMYQTAERQFQALRRAGENKQSPAPAGPAEGNM